MIRAIQWKSVSKVLVIMREQSIIWIKSRSVNEADQAKTFALNQRTGMDARSDIFVTTSKTPTERKFACIIAGENPCVVTWDLMCIMIIKEGP